MHFQHSLGIMHGELSGHKTLSIWVKPTVTANTGGHIHILANTVAHIHFLDNTGGYINLAATAGRHIHITTQSEGHIHIPAHTGVHIRIPATVWAHTRDIDNTRGNKGGSTHVTVNTYIVANTGDHVHLIPNEGSHAYITANVGGRGPLTLLLTLGFTVTLKMLLTQGVMAVSLPLLGLTSTLLLPSHISCLHHCQCHGSRPHTLIPPARPFCDTTCSPPRHLNCTNHPRCHAWPAPPGLLPYGPTS